MINFEGGAIPEEYQNEYVVDRVETTATTWLGLTMGCARCHDHKYDPITQKDFYRFFAFFNTIAKRVWTGEAAMPSRSCSCRRRSRNSDRKALAAASDRRHEKALADETRSRRCAKAWETGRACQSAGDAARGSAGPVRVRRQPGRHLRALPPRARAQRRSDLRRGRRRQRRRVRRRDARQLRPASDFDSANRFSIALWMRPSGAREMPVLTQLTADGRGFEIVSGRLRFSPTFSSAVRASSCASATPRRRHRSLDDSDRLDVGGCGIRSR